MSTRRDQILDAQLAALNASPPSGVPQASREMLDDLPESVALAISIGEAREVVERSGPRVPVVQRRLITAVDLWARAASGIPAGKVMDALFEHVTAALGGNNLGGLIDTEHELEIHWDRERRLTGIAHATVFIVAKYMTRVDNAAVRS